MSEITLRHGIFLPPFHPNEENPTACLERDLDLIQHLDKLGFHEAWIGEHHSAGYESPSPPSAPATYGSAPASSRCPITTR
jgi:limonene 1,2-monooxygenase